MAKGPAEQFVDLIRETLVSTFDQSELQARAHAALDAFIQGPEFRFRSSTLDARVLLSDVRDRLKGLDHLRWDEKQVCNSIIAKVEQLIQVY